MYPPPPSSTYVHFSELPPPLSQKKFRDAYDALISNKKSEGEKRERINFFCKFNIKHQCFLRSFLYNNNTNIYMFIEKR